LTTYFTIIFLLSAIVLQHAIRVKRLAYEDIRRAVELALAEDLGGGDATTLSTVPPEARAVALMVAREELVLAGVELAEAAFLRLGPDLTLERLAEDGRRVAAGGAILRVSGAARAILSAERVALNYAQRLSGVATLASKFVAAIAGTKAKILDTRKTTPGLRLLEKYAVTCGGGCNHRIGLYDMVLIKDNHLAALRDEKPNAIAAAVARARKEYPKLKVEVEADTLTQVEQAVAARADYVLLDNMTVAQLRAAVALAAGKVLTEASGGVNLSTVRGIAETGVDYISVGALTHSARAVDIALDFEAGA
jgi:nicotinate-nucleotide pyrophosphorylase (carboxylating)